MTPPLTALVEALREMIETQASWEASIEKIIGRQPNVFPRALDRARAALSAFEAEPQGVEALRTAIAEALFLYNQAEDERRRGKRAWGKEHAEWRADAVCLELQRLGLLPLPSRRR